MKTQFTPGPWAIRNQTSPNVLNPRIVSLAPNGIVRKIIAQCYIHTLDHNNAISKEEAEANANIIAAAPELFTALKLIVIHFGEEKLTDRQKQLIRRGLNAIAKATGEKEVQL